MENLDLARGHPATRLHSPSEKKERKRKKEKEKEEGRRRRREGRKIVKIESI